MFQYKKKRSISLESQIPPGLCGFLGPALHTWSSGPLGCRLRSRRLLGVLPAPPETLLLLPDSLQDHFKAGLLQPWPSCFRAFKGKQTPVFSLEVCHTREKAVRAGVCPLTSRTLRPPPSPAPSRAVAWEPQLTVQVARRPLGKGPSSRHLSGAGDGWVAVLTAASSGHQPSTRQSCLISVICKIGMIS